MSTDKQLVISASHWELRSIPISVSGRRKLQPELVFPLNCAVRKARKSVPYTVVYGQAQTIPIDVLFGNTNVSSSQDWVSPADYTEEMGLISKHLWNDVRMHLESSKKKMLEQYNRKLQFNDYLPGSKIWLKSDVINSGDNKLAP